MAEGIIQQWIAAQAVGDAGFDAGEVWLYYLSSGGSLGEMELAGHLAGLLMIPSAQRDLAAEAINELLEDRAGSKRAHYSSGAG
ncbi:hypothetical protein D6T65_15600 [Arthrobacter frigidicola]|nr:hypothetical protein D6T65_15600 [Arthrobacter frigidicola]